MLKICVDLLIGYSDLVFFDVDAEKCLVRSLFIYVYEFMSQMDELCVCEARGRDGRKEKRE